LGVLVESSHYGYFNPDLTASSTVGAVGISAQFFLSPVLDDDSPRSLQPFLQHVGSLALSISPGAGSISGGSRSPFGVHGSSSEAFSSEGIGVDAYVTKVAAITATLSHSYVGTTGSFNNLTSHSISVSAGGGAHLGDTRLDFAYTFEASSQHGDFATPVFGVISAGVHTVFGRHVELSLAARGFDTGLGGSGELTGYIGKSVALFIGAFGDYHRRRVAHGAPDNRYGTFAGVGVWAGPVLHLVGSYTLSGFTVPSKYASADAAANGLSHAGRLTSEFRF
jgi:hypothetical protein